MKTKSIVTMTIIALLSLTGFAQTPPAPAPPAPPAPPIPPEHREDKGPKVPVTYLGVETSEVPRVLSEQLGLARGFGLVVDYVSPDGPAAAAGVKESDILKMFNDQILTEPGQLAKLVRSNQEGATVTLTVLRKGEEQKISVKLGKREISEHRHMNFGPGFEHHMNHDFGNVDLSELKDKMKDLQGQMGDEQRGMIHDMVQKAHEEANRAREEARRAAREIRVRSLNNGELKSTRIDLGKAQVVYSDDKGEMKIENVDGKKVLTAKDPQGKLLFSGPIESKEELDKLPPDVRQRYDKLEQKDLPEVGSVNVDVRTDTDTNDEDNDNDNDSSDDSSTETTQQISTPRPTNQQLPANAVLL